MKNILKNKGKLIVGILVVAVLIFAYWWGGNAPSLRGWSADETTGPAIGAEIDVDKVEEESGQSEGNSNSSNGAVYGDLQFEAGDSNAVVDKYQTSPVPEGKPDPVEPQGVTVGDTELTCTLSVRCDTVLDNLDWLEEEKLDIVPADGVIFAEKEVAFYEGESVFDVLKREMMNNKIHFEFVNTPMYNSAYVEGIANLYEFDCGELSGWMYKVNGWFPNYGCSRYALEDGDKIEWVYTCDRGSDVGGGEW